MEAVHAQARRTDRRVISRRLPPHADANAVTRVLAELRLAGVPIVDLTESNPTRCRIPYPAGLLDALADPQACHYEPHPFGLPAAREAVAADQRRRGARVDPAHVVLTTGTSEAYAWLFKLLCDPGDAVLVPQPSYPLFEHLSALEGIAAHPYRLEYHGRWSIDVDSIRAAPAGVRALLIVSPNNPTGSCVTPREVEAVAAICRAHGWALIADEVFADYPLEASDYITDIAARSDVLSFTLAGLSKTAGLPQLKLGWCVAGGPAGERDAALGALELIADSYLSVGTPVQVAAAHLLEAGASIRAAIQARVGRNLKALRAAAARHPACEVLKMEGGWSAVIRVPSTRTEEQLTLDLLRTERILVHPGYFFDFPRETYLVVSLLPPDDVFDEAGARLLQFLSL
jgi:aspartate/methionine/tyrosine aminotransferase